ncbi:MAG: TIGR01841 family phasin [Caulobacteraceae bacterium]|nr:TIGR01841 family phasin [Caulobacter sp.]
MADTTTAANTAADAARDTANTAADAANRTANTAAEGAQRTFAAGQQAWKDGVDKAASSSNQAFKDAADRSLSALNELNAQGKRNLEAMIASVTAATRGAEALGAQAMTYAKSSVETQVDAARQMSGARSMQEIVELQTSFAKKAMEGYISEMNKASEIVSAAVKDAMKPLNERAAAMTETVQAQR